MNNVVVYSQLDDYGLREIRQALDEENSRLNEKARASSGAWVSWPDRVQHECGSAFVSTQLSCGCVMHEFYAHLESQQVNTTGWMTCTCGGSIATAPGSHVIVLCDDHKIAD